MTVFAGECDDMDSARVRLAHIGVPCVIAAEFSNGGCRLCASTLAEAEAIAAQAFDVSLTHRIRIERAGERERLGKP